MTSPQKSNRCIEEDDNLNLHKELEKQLEEENQKANEKIF